jgi:hypothetical protein
MLRKLAFVLALAGAWYAVVVLLRNPPGRRRERVDLYFADGSMATLADGSPEATRLLGLAREALQSARVA